MSDIWCTDVKVQKDKTVTHISYFEEAGEIRHHVPMGEHDSLRVSCVIRQRTTHQHHMDETPFTYMEIKQSSLFLLCFFYMKSLKPGKARKG